MNELSVTNAETSAGPAEPLWLTLACVPYQAVGRPGLSGSSLEPHLEAPQHLPVPKHLPGPGGTDEPSDLEELEKFAKTFKQRRIKLGFTQVGLGSSRWKTWVV